MPTLLIRTRYKSHPSGSNVGNIEARLSGTRRIVRSDQSLSSIDNHRRAAEKIAEHFGLTIVDARPEFMVDGGYTFAATT